MPEAGFALKTQQLFSTSTGAEQSLPLCLPRFTFTVCLRSQYQVFGYFFSNMKDEVLLMAISVGLTVIVFVLIAFIKKFIRSRPPGRRLVTSDIQVEAEISLKRFSGFYQCPSKKKTLIHHRYIKLHGWRFVFSVSVYNVFSYRTENAKEDKFILTVQSHQIVLELSLIHFWIRPETFESILVEPMWVLSLSRQFQNCFWD